MSPISSTPMANTDPCMGWDATVWNKTGLFNQVQAKACFRQAALKQPIVQEVKVKYHAIMMPTF